MSMAPFYSNIRSNQGMIPSTFPLWTRDFVGGLDRLDRHEARRFRDGAGAPPQPPQAGVPLLCRCAFRPSTCRRVSTSSTAKKGRRTSPCCCAFRPPAYRAVSTSSTTRSAEVSRRRWRASSTTEEREVVVSTSSTTGKVSTSSTTSTAGAPPQPPQAGALLPGRCAFRPPKCRQVSTSSTTRTAGAPPQPPQAGVPLLVAALFDHPRSRSRGVVVSTRSLALAARPSELRRFRDGAGAPPQPPKSARREPAGASPRRCACHHP